MRAGEGTRAGLADACSLSTATMTNIIADLITERLVSDAGRLPSDGGRPITRLVPNSDGAYAIGADVGEHGITIDLFDLHLSLVDRIRTQLQPADFTPEHVRTVLQRSVDELRDRNPTVVDQIVGLGLGLPGVVDQTTSGHFTVAPHNLGWPVVPLSQLAPELDVVVVAENGAKAMATAESWRGAAIGAEHCVAALVGRGVGAGIVNDGQLVRGASGSAGEWGHSKVTIGGRRCHCGGTGCLEAYIGGSSIIQRWNEIGGNTTGDDERDLVQLIQLASNGDGPASKLLDETIEIFGLGLSNLVNLLNPQVIVIGGWVGDAITARHLPQLRAATSNYALTRPATDVHIEPSPLGDDSVALGAALLIFQLLISGDITVPDVR